MTTGETLYVYEDWTCEEAPRCFYVGKGMLNRVKRNTRNQLHTNIVNKYVMLHNLPELPVHAVMY